MGKYIIFENDKEALAILYGLLKREKADKEFLLVKCDYNHNVPEEMAEEKEEKELQEYLNKEISKYDLGPLPRTEIMMTGEILLDSVSRGDISYEEDDILVMDITLYDKLEAGKDSFDDYVSVKMADKLVKEGKILKENVRFYTRASSESDPSAFLEQTGGRWRVPVLRPSNFDSPGNEEEVKEFIDELIN